MVPQPTHTIDYSLEYADFIAKVRAYHQKRGTNFDAEPKVGQVHVDLLQLYKLINSHGGYDKVSDEKLAWRNMVNTLGLYSTNEASAAYSLKVIYYKNLAAYEITTIHNKEPPPPEILEHTSAKGGSLLTRTLENYGHRVARNAGSLGADAVSDRSGDDATPSRERRVNDVTSTGRASRGLREAPAQRVPFQPDTGSSRQTRHSSGHHGHAGATSNSHTPSHGPSSHASHGQVHGLHHHSPLSQQPHSRNASVMFNPPPGTENFSQAVQNYEPRGPAALHLQPVETPGNSPAEFARRSRLTKLQSMGITPGHMQNRPPQMPGFEGPNIYIRCLLALRSGLPSEEAFALNHLVKISYERGDKYKFESFSGLAEGLTEKVLQVGGLFFEVNWTISYDPDTDENDVGELDGVHGTADILERISQLKPRPVLDSVQTEEFCDQVVLMTEAALTIRNMVQLTENAYFMADFPPVRDLICIVLNLPSSESVVELKHCALDIAEQLTPWLVLRHDDPLYQTLLGQLQSTDRGVILTALRAVGRISSNLTHANSLGNVPPVVLQNIMNWLLLNDDELVDACLDFLYQYTAVVSNMKTLLTSVVPENLVAHLVRLLSHGGKRGQREIVLEPEKIIPAPSFAPPVPADLLERLVAKDEPERCYAWLRCSFEEDPDSSITQISIWQSYQANFSAKVVQAGRSMLGAAEFIRNVTHVFHSAGAQIQREGERGEVQMYIIKGIRARRQAVNEKGDEYFRCQWGMDWPNRPKQLCGNFFATVGEMYQHVLSKHLQLTPDNDGNIRNEEQPLQCLWWDCNLYREPTKMRLAALATHLRTHIASTFQTPSQQNGASASNNGEVGSATPGGGNNKRQRRWWVVPARTINLPYEETLVTRDERNPNAPPQAGGIPLSAVLVLRNMARNVGKTEAEGGLLKQREEAGGGDDGGEQEARTIWKERLFRPLLPRLFEILTENRALAMYMASLIDLIQG